MSFETLETSRAAEREHFGFRDGISQPQFAGLGPGASADAIRTGEVLLGYRNEYDRFTPRPLLNPADDPHDVLPPDRENRGCRDLGLSGSYLTFRQLRQDVHAFWEFCERATTLPDGRVDEEGRLRLAAKLVGRWPSGTPLALAPDHDRPHLQTANDFSYFHSDPDGLRCPVGAHIRRANPRDSLDPAPGTDRSVSVNRLHRLLRRGRKYGPLLPREDLLAQASTRRGERTSAACISSAWERTSRVNSSSSSRRGSTTHGSPGCLTLPIPCSDPQPLADRMFAVPAIPTRTRYRDATAVRVRPRGRLFLPSRDPRVAISGHAANASVTSSPPSSPQPDDDQVGPVAHKLEDALSAGLVASHYLDRYYRDAVDRSSGRRWSQSSRRWSTAGARVRRSGSPRSVSFQARPRPHSRSSLG